MGSTYELKIEGQPYVVVHGFSSAPQLELGLYCDYRNPKGRSLAATTLLELLEEFWNENPVPGPEDLYDL